MRNIAEVTALAALIVVFPLNCMANVREQGAEMTFCVGGKLAQFHRNDTSAADGSADTTACNWCILLPLSLHMCSCFGQLRAYNILQSGYHHILEQMLLFVNMIGFEFSNL